MALHVRLEVKRSCTALDVMTETSRDSKVQMYALSDIGRIQKIRATSLTANIG